MTECITRVAVPSAGAAGGLFSRGIILPDAFQVRLIVWPDIINSILGDDAEIHVAAGSEIVKYTGSDGVAY